MGQRAELLTFMRAGTSASRFERRLWTAFLPTVIACQAQVLESKPNDGGAAADATVSADAMPVDASSDVLYWQWWFPECGVAPGQPCTNPACWPTSLGASDVGGCQLTTSSSGGCVPIQSAGTECNLTYYARDLERTISAAVPPYTMTGLTSCGEPCGYPDVPPSCCPWVDAGGMTDAGTGG